MVDIKQTFIDGGNRWCTSIIENAPKEIFSGLCQLKYGFSSKTWQGQGNRGRVTPILLKVGAVALPFIAAAGAISAIQTATAASLFFGMIEATSCLAIAHDFAVLGDNIEAQRKKWRPDPPKDVKNMTELNHITGKAFSGSSNKQVSEEAFLKGLWEAYKAKVSQEWNNTFSSIPEKNRKIRSAREMMKNHVPEIVENTFIVRPFINLLKKIGASNLDVTQQD